MIEELKLWRYIRFRSCPGCFKVKVRDGGWRIRRLGGGVISLITGTMVTNG